MGWAGCTTGTATAALVARGHGGGAPHTTVFWYDYAFFGESLEQVCSVNAELFCAVCCLPPFCGSKGSNEENGAA